LPLTKRERTTQSRRDYKREAKGRYRGSLEAGLIEVLGPLMNDEPLAARYRDHAPAGEWSGYRDCHVKPDLVLIYEKPDADMLRLIRLGSHSQLGW
jgi:mRNA interferase YafQ